MCSLHSKVALDLEMKGRIDVSERPGRQLFIGIVKGHEATKDDTPTAVLFNSTKFCRTRSSR